MLSTNKVLAIIINYHNYQDTEECINSIPKANNISIMLIDQEGDPKVIQQLSKKFSSLKIKSTEKNMGFAAAANLGLSYALKQGYRYSLLLNNDIVVNPQTIPALIRSIEASPKYAIAAPLQYFYKKKKIAFSGGFFNLKTGLTPHFTDKLVADRLTDFSTGAAILIKNKLLAKIGLFSTKYFLYYEDLDFCQKIKMAGYAQIVSAQANVEHKVSNTSKNYPFIYYYCQRNRLMFYKKYGSNRYYLFFLMNFIKDLLLIILRGFFKPFKQDNFKILYYSLYGIIDYIKGKTGSNENL